MVGVLSCRRPRPGKVSECSRRRRRWWWRRWRGGGSGGGGPLSSGTAHHLSYMYSFPPPSIDHSNSTPLPPPFLCYLLPSLLIPPSPCSSSSSSSSSPPPTSSSSASSSSSPFITHHHAYLFLFTSCCTTHSHHNPQPPLGCTPTIVSSLLTFFFFYFFFFSFFLFSYSLPIHACMTIRTPPYRISSSSLPAHNPLYAEMPDSESQWIFTEEELLRTPSVLDGLSPELEREQRGKGCNFIMQLGIQLGLPQVTLATASMFLHRFYMQNSLKKHHYYVRPSFGVDVTTPRALWF